MLRWWESPRHGDSCSANVRGMKFTLERFGGIAAIRKPPLVVDTAQLPREDAEKIEALAEEVLSARGGARRARAAAPSGAQPDAVSYELKIAEEEDEHALSFDYAKASEPVQQLVAALRATTKDC